MRNHLSFSFLRTFPGALVTGILVIQAIIFYIAPTTEYIPNPPPLNVFPESVGVWKMRFESPLDKETQTFLKADDTVNRAYGGPEGQVSLFVAFFRSQRGGVTPHSPKICLPGSGWTPEESSIVPVQVADGESIPVNRYIVRHGEDRNLVLYWYATAHHTMANEYVSKLYLMHEGLRYRRSDEAVFRVIAPIVGNNEASAQQLAVSFIQSFYPSLRRQMWVKQ